LDFRKTTMDLGSSASMLVYPDSVATFYLNAALEFAAMRSLGFAKHDTVSLVDGRLDYSLARDAIMPRSAKILYPDGNAQGVGYVSPTDISTQDQSLLGWTIYDTMVTVTKEVSAKYKLIVVYIAMPASMDSSGADCELPNVLEHALVNRAVSIAFVATKVPAIVEQGARLAAEATQAFDDYASRHVMMPTDTGKVVK